MSETKETHQEEWWLTVLKWFSYIVFGSLAIFLIAGLSGGIYYTLSEGTRFAYSVGLAMGSPKWLLLGLVIVLIFAADYSGSKARKAKRNSNPEAPHKP
ncbi:hypothetical protein [Comamonas aquatica]|uniref:hypothetical protein n=1 Tax=Comamonas aquatica TaxID=225991 RepID=UPI0021B155D7|nr:hypothetical protein [Comamonas aquatica]